MSRRKHSGAGKPSRSVRVRSRPLDQIDEAKLALALAIMARRLLEERAAKRTAPRSNAADSGEVV